MSDRQRRKEEQRHRRAIEHIERLERELGIEDDGLVDLSDDPPKEQEPSPWIRLANKLDEQTPPQLRLNWDIDSKTGALVAKEKPTSLVSISPSAYAISAVSHARAVEGAYFFGASDE